MSLKINDESNIRKNKMKTNESIEDFFVLKEEINNKIEIKEDSYNINSKFYDSDDSDIQIIDYKTKIRMDDSILSKGGIINS